MIRAVVFAQGNPRSSSSWSGIPAAICAQLEKRGFDILVVGTPLMDKIFWAGAKLPWLGLFPNRERALVYAHQKTVSRTLLKLRPDVLVSIGAPHKIVGLARDWPSAHVTDMMFAQVAEQYPKYMRLNGRAVRIGNRMQQELLDRATLVSVASQWAREEAMRSYRFNKDNVIVAPFGANLTDVPEPGYAVLPGPLRFLFVGADWQRKGGRTALEIFKKIRATIADAEFHIAGCAPQEASSVPGVTVHGFLSKGNPAQRGRLLRLFNQASFFLMPSRQEAYGIVYCEASAFGVPPIAAKVGGVGEIIENGVNGLLLPADADPEAYAAAVLTVWRDPSRYEKMRRAARMAYETKLNWDVWGETFERELLQRLTPGMRL